MSQFERENDLGGAGGEIEDEEMPDEARDDAAERGSGANIDDPLAAGGPGPWANASSGDVDEP